MLKLNIDTLKSIKVKVKANPFTLSNLASFASNCGLFHALSIYCYGGGGQQMASGSNTKT